MELKYKIWLEDGGNQVFGDGVYRLLILIDRYGSINQAAHMEKMSYRQAWGKIKRIEDRLKVKLLDRRVGGEAGGGATLTPAGKRFLEEYEQIVKQFDELISKVSKKLIETLEDVVLD
jgi:molybdate transport system regulatory protein